MAWPLLFKVIKTDMSFIEKIMVRAALSGLKVARLKGGDPLIFGRAGEEIETLHAQQIKVTVINGISAGLAGALESTAP